MSTLGSTIVSTVSSTIALQWHLPSTRQYLDDVIESVAPQLCQIDGVRPNRMFWPLNSNSQPITWQGLDVTQLDESHSISATAVSASSTSTSSPFGAEDELLLKLCIAWIVSNGSLLEALDSNHSLVKTHFALRRLFNIRDWQRLIQPPAQIFARPPATLTWLLFQIWKTYSNSIKKNIANR
jgi:hypothetical protein